jgi:hypothetical protein
MKWVLLFVVMLVFLPHLLQLFSQPISIVAMWAFCLLYLSSDSLLVYLNYVFRVFDLSILCKYGFNQGNIEWNHAIVLVILTDYQKFVLLANIIMIGVFILWLLNYLYYLNLISNQCYYIFHIPQYTLQFFCWSVAVYVFFVGTDNRFFICFLLALHRLLNNLHIAKHYTLRLCMVVGNTSNYSAFGSNYIIEDIF